VALGQESLPDAAGVRYHDGGIRVPDSTFRALHVASVEDAEGWTQVCQQATEGRVDLLVVSAGKLRGKNAKRFEQLHGKRDSAWVPIIAVTAPLNRKSRMTALPALADDFVARPVKRADLLVRTRTMLRMKELHGDLRKRNAELEQVNEELGRLNQELASRNRELEQGMEMANKVQDALLPQEYPEVKNISFCHLYMPADVVGGDLFQMKGMSGERAAIMLCDVSGHGIRAALVTSLLKAVFEHVYFEDKNTKQILCDVNSRFRNILGQLSPHIFATGLLMVVNGQECTVSVASAGHAPPLLIRKRNMSCEPLMGEELVGPALGFFQSPDYQTVERKLQHGDIVLGFTDGVYEVTNNEGEMYGLPRLMRFVGANARLIPRDLIQKIVTETDEFRGPRRRQDDVCLVAIEVH